MIVSYIYCTGSEHILWLTTDLDQLFSTYLTTATSEVLESELVMCRELLQLEPDNKCNERAILIYLFVSLRVSTNNSPVAGSY